MTTYERDSWVRAPLDRVWSFHRGVDGLAALTPGWMGLRVEGVTGPDGEADPNALDPGSTVELSVRPFGIGPRRGWTSEIVARERGDGTAYFRDVLVEGPFPEWEHTHLFYADGERTRCRDRVRYRTPAGPLAPVADEAAKLGLDVVFRRRHRRLAASVEGE